MKKSAKAKTSPKAKAPKSEMPDLVTIMTKLVERLEILERKTDQVLGRLGSLPTQLTQAAQNFQRPEPLRYTQPSQNAGHNPLQTQNPRERILYQAVCADCCKRCEVPFKPSGDRPVYCPECFAIRKAGHVPKDLTSRVVVPHHLKTVGVASGEGGKESDASRGKQSKPGKGSKKSAPKSGGKKKKK